MCISKEEKNRAEQVVRDWFLSNYVLKKGSFINMETLWAHYRRDINSIKGDQVIWGFQGFSDLLLDLGLEIKLKDDPSFLFCLAVGKLIDPSTFEPLINLPSGDPSMSLVFYNFTLKNVDPELRVPYQLLGDINLSSLEFFPEFIRFEDL